MIAAIALAPADFDRLEAGRHILTGGAARVRIPGAAAGGAEEVTIHLSLASARELHAQLGAFLAAERVLA